MTSLSLVKVEHLGRETSLCKCINYSVFSNGWWTLLALSRSDSCGFRACLELSERYISCVDWRSLLSVVLLYSSGHLYHVKAARRKIANTFVMYNLLRSYYWPLIRMVVCFFAKTLCSIRFTIWIKNLILLPIRRTVTIRLIRFQRQIIKSI